MAIAIRLSEVGRYEENKAELAYQVGSSKIIAKSFSDTIDTDKVPTVATLKKYRGEGMTAIWITNWILQLSGFFAVKGGIEEYQLEVASDLIMEEYYYFTIADFTLFGKKAIKGDFGTAYNRFDVPTLLEWLKKYRTMRLEHSAHKSQKEHKETLEEVQVIDMPDNIKELMHKLNKPDKAKATIKQGDFESAKKELGEYWLTEWEQSDKSKSYNDFCAIRFQNLIKSRKKI